MKVEESGSGRSSGSSACDLAISLLFFPQLICSSFSPRLILSSLSSADQNQTPRAFQATYSGKKAVFAAVFYKAVLKENRPRLLVLKVARIELGNSVANSIKQENKLHLKENSFHRFSPKSLSRAISSLLLGDNIVKKKNRVTL